MQNRGCSSVVIHKTTIRQTRTFNFHVMYYSLCNAIISFDYENCYFKYEICFQYYFCTHYPPWDACSFGTMDLGKLKNVSGSEITHQYGRFLFLEIILEYRIEHVTMKFLCKFIYSTGILCKGFQDWLSLWCLWRALTTCILYASSNFGDLILNDSWCVFLTKWISFSF